MPKKRLSHLLNLHYISRENSDFMKCNITILFLSSLLTLTFCCNSLKAQTIVKKEGNKSDVNKILNNIKNFSEHIMASNYQEIGNAYTLEAKIFPYSKEIIAGRENIIKYWVLPKGVRTNYHKITPKEIKVTGKEAYNYGYYEGQYGSDSNAGTIKIKSQYGGVSINEY